MYSHTCSIFTLIVSENKKIYFLKSNGSKLLFQYDYSYVVDKLENKGWICLFNPFIIIITINPIINKKFPLKKLFSLVFKYLCK